MWKSITVLFSIVLGISRVCYSGTTSSDVFLDIERKSNDGQIEKDAYPRGPLRDRFQDSCLDEQYKKIIKALASFDGSEEFEFQYFVQVSETDVKPEQVCDGKDLQLQIVATKPGQSQNLTGLFGIVIDQRTPDQQIQEARREAAQISSELTRAFQKAQEASKSHSDLNVIKSIPKDFLQLVKAPLSWNKRQWWIASEIIGITGLMMALDEPSRKFFVDNYDRFDKVTWNAIEKFGNGYVLFPALAMTYLTGKLIKNEKLTRVATLGFSSAIISGAITNILKFMTGRHRPYTNSNSLDFDGPVFQFNNKNQSFPSGHATNAFAVATIISMTYKDQPIVGAMAYVAATLVGVQRVLDQKHWSSDVFLGAVIGHVVAKFIYEKYTGARYSKDRKWLILPAYIKDGRDYVIGLEATRSW